MGSEQVEAVQGGMLPRSGDEPFVGNGSNEAAAVGVLPRELQQGASAAVCDEPCVSSRLRFSKEQNIFHKT